MELRNHGRAARLYYWSAEVFDQFLHCEFGYSRTQTNLCAYCRTVFLWMPLALTINAATLALTVYATVAYPIILFGFKAWGITVVALAAAAGIIALRVRENKRVAAVADAPAKSSTQPQPTEPGIAAIIGLRLMAAKSKVCPLITFTEETEEVFQ